MMKFYNKIYTSRDSLDYDIDGIVYKLDSFYNQNKLGDSTRWPRWALAHKFPSKEAKTKLLNITVQVGRTGVLTPVAELQGITIGGVRVTRATLHNEDEIERLDIRIGDIVTVQRAGDVIPKITSVDFSKRLDNSVKFNFPNTCPSCKSSTERLSEDKNRRCINSSCESQLLGSLRHFVSREAFNIFGLGEKQLKQLLVNNMISDSKDIFLLEQKHKEKVFSIDKLPGWGLKARDNLFNSINNRRNISYDRFIYSLGIRHIGKEIATLISREIFPIDKLITITQSLRDEKSSEWEKLNNMHGVGKVLIDSLSNYFSNEINLKIINSLCSEIKINYVRNKKNIGNFLEKVVVFTGSLESMARKEAIEKVEEQGGVVVANINRKVNLLIVGKDSGTKLNIARSLYIDILEDSAFIRMLDN